VNVAGGAFSPVHKPFACKTFSGLPKALPAVHVRGGGHADASAGGTDGAAIHDAAVEPWLMCSPGKPRRASTCNVYVARRVCPYDAAVCTC
jgi:hypothetical protein